jgi:hypothetical protein
MFETILSGVLVFVLGQIFVKLILEPVNKLKQTFAAVSHAYLLHIRVLYGPMGANDSDLTKAQDDFRLLSGNLCSDLCLIPSYGFWRLVFFLPEEAAIYKAAKSLIALGSWIKVNNTARQEYVIKHWQSAADQLGLYIDPASRVSDEVLDQAIKNALSK